MSAAVEQQFSVTAPDCQYRISARQATMTLGKIPPCFFCVFSCPFPGAVIHQEGTAACDPSGEAAQPQLFTPLPGPSPFLAPQHFSLSPAFPTPMSFQASLQLCVSWPALLGISSPPILTSQLNIFHFLAGSLPSCCVGCWERFFLP